MTRANGILTAFIEPSGGVISGQGCLIDLNGWVPREMVIADAVALNVHIPPYVSRSPDSRRPGLGQNPDRPGPGGQGAAAPTRPFRRGKIASTISKSCSDGRSLTTPSARKPANAGRRRRHLT